MKIAVLVSNPCVIDARVIRMSEAEVKLNFKVKVFATLKGKNLLEEEIKNGVEYKRIEWDLSKYCKNYIPKFIKNRKIKGYLVKKLSKYLKYYSYRDTFIKEVLAYKPDIIHAHDLVCLPLGYELKKLTGAKLIYDAHELEIYRNPPLSLDEKIYTDFIEKKYAKYADTVITVNDSIANILKKRLTINKIYVIRNTPVIKSYRGKSLREKLKLRNNKKILLYVGKITINRGIELVLEQMNNLKDNIHFVCVGHKDKKFAEQLIQLAKKNKVMDRFHILEPIVHEQVVDFIKEADLGISAINPITKSYYYSLPNKIFEMSLAGLPIIATDLPEIRKVLDSIGNGYYFEPDKKEKITDLINEVLENLKKGTIDKKQILKKAREYSWENESKEIQKVFNELFN